MRISVWLAASFVGGIHECPVNLDVRKSIDNLFFMSYNEFVYFYVVIMEVYMDTALIKRIGKAVLRSLLLFFCVCVCRDSFACRV